MPVWKVHIKGIATLQDRYSEGEIAFEQMRDGVVKILRLKLGRHLREPNLDYDLDEMLDELTDVESDDEYDFVKDRLYDWCDDHRVWIDPID